MIIIINEIKSMKWTEWFYGPPDICTSIKWNESLFFLLTHAFVCTHMEDFCVGDGDNDYQWNQIKSNQIKSNQWNEYLPFLVLKLHTFVRTCMEDFCVGDGDNDYQWNQINLIKSN